MIIILAIIVILIILILSKYNKILKLKNKVKQAESGIDIYLNERFELIPNLVECVKAYTKYEKETLEKIIGMRSEYIKTGKNDLNKAQTLNNEINKIMAIAENYPELKANEQYLNLQKNLSKMESQLQAARRIYNGEVTEYNTTISVIPNNLIAKLFGFKEEKLFEIDEQNKINVKIEG